MRFEKSSGGVRVRLCEACSKRKSRKKNERKWFWFSSSHNNSYSCGAEFDVLFCVWHCDLPHIESSWPLLSHFYIGLDPLSRPHCMYMVPHRSKFNTLHIISLYISDRPDNFSTLFLPVKLILSDIICVKHYRVTDILLILKCFFS